MSDPLGQRRRRFMLDARHFVVADAAGPAGLLLTTPACPDRATLFWKGTIPSAARRLAGSHPHDSSTNRAAVPGVRLATQVRKHLVKEGRFAAESAARGYPRRPRVHATPASSTSSSFARTREVGRLHFALAILLASGRCRARSDRNWSGRAFKGVPSALRRQAKRRSLARLVCPAEFVPRATLARGWAPARSVVSSHRGG